MAMLSDDISGREFVVAQEGYDRGEVRAYLEFVAREQQALRDEIAALRENHRDGGEVGSEIANLLQTARQTAEDAVRSASEEAEAIRARAELDADTLRQATIDATDRAREEADLYAFETRANADREARDRLRETAERIETLMSGASRVRDRLFELDTVLVGLRSEVSQAAESLDPSTAEAVQASELPPPPPPPAVIDLRDAESNGTRVTAQA